MGLRQPHSPGCRMGEPAGSERAVRRTDLFRLRPGRSADRRSARPVGTAREKPHAAENRRREQYRVAEVAYPLADREPETRARFAGRAAAVRDDARFRRAGPQAENPRSVLYAVYFAAYSGAAETCRIRSREPTHEYASLGRIGIAVCQQRNLLSGDADRGRHRERAPVGPARPDRNGRGHHPDRRTMPRQQLHRPDPQRARQCRFRRRAGYIRIAGQRSANDPAGVPYSVAARVSRCHRSRSVHRLPGAPLLRYGRARNRARRSGLAARLVSGRRENDSGIRIRKQYSGCLCRNAGLRR